jgi:hypothetical protein
MQPTDLVVDVFLLLRDSFFGASMQPAPFELRQKRNTQDDPLDEYISRLLEAGLKDAACRKAPGPLITPDLVVYRPVLCDGQPRETLVTDTTRILGLEVKKLERTASGGIARSTGLDYNTTPPCGTVQVYAADDSPLRVRGYYLFVAQEAAPEGKFILSAMALCDGDILNADFDLYLSIVSQREKQLGLGTYGDGVNRQRPMLIFANPLGARDLDQTATLVTASAADDRIRLVYRVVRTTTSGDLSHFYAFRKATDVPSGWQVQTLTDPFPQPKNRVVQTQSRGRFRLPIHVQ